MQFYVYPKNNVVIIYLYNKIRQTLYHVPSAYKNNRGLYTRTTLVETKKKMQSAPFNFSNISMLQAKYCSSISHTCFPSPFRSIL